MRMLRRLPPMVRRRRRTVRLLRRMARRLRRMARLLRRTVRPRALLDTPRPQPHRRRLVPQPASPEAQRALLAGALPPLRATPRRPVPAIQTRPARAQVKPRRPVREQAKPPPQALGQAKPPPLLVRTVGALAKRRVAPKYRPRKMVLRSPSARTATSRQSMTASAAWMFITG
jgi:hypothetical protein